MIYSRDIRSLNQSRTNVISSLMERNWTTPTANANQYAMRMMRIICRQSRCLMVTAIPSDARQANAPPMSSNDHRAGSGWNATVNHPNEESATSNNGNRKNVRNLRYTCGIKRQLRAVYSMSSHGLMGVQNGIYQPRTVPSTGSKASAAYNK